ncbi:class I SAM-dependent methyltransferase [Acidicapsa dinghuensis]|uniref:Class I SAM-dependent methyltransferase n=1 Tax=Acidicapsa dinghuensis TaxID=2218256 RepID=A0ABW1ELR9_9BACT|nr:class I SAM-dependent methyltransferase [Acidicapsa dinghuensis]
MSLAMEYDHWKSVVRGLSKPKVPIEPYVPVDRRSPSRHLPVPSAWEGIPSILADIFQRFRLKTRLCLEFGVEYGYSTVALSSFFDHVIGVDTFEGDKHTVNKSNIFELTQERLSVYPNISLVRSDYRDYIRNEVRNFDLIHVDIVHTFADTYACGLWSAQHSHCTLFHDTQSFPQVKQAVREIARATGKRFYNYQESHGLGVLL